MKSNFKKKHPIFMSFTSHPFWNTLQYSLKKPSSFIKKNGRFLLCLFVAFLFADLLLIKSYNFLLPDKELPPLSSARQASHKNRSSESYKNLWENNIFHTGPIPLKLEEASMSSDPVLSSLPFKLKGTIVHANPRRSVATIKAGSNNKTSSYQQGNTIEKQAEIKEIQRAKVIFFNQNNNRLEYIVIPEEQKSLSISYAKNKPKILENSLVKRTGSNSFQVKRSDINKYMQKLPEILKQARVVPHRKGYRFSAIDKDGVFEELGFEKGDIIKEVDGEPMAPPNPEKALELFDRLKGSSGFKMLVQRKGKDIYYEYNVRENAPIR